MKKETEKEKGKKKESKQGKLVNKENKKKENKLKNIVRKTNPSYLGWSICCSLLISQIF